MLPLPLLVERLREQADAAQTEGRMADAWNMREAAVRLNAANVALEMMDPAREGVETLQRALAGDPISQT